MILDEQLWITSKSQLYFVVFGKFLGINGQKPSVFKSNLL